MIPPTAETRWADSFWGYAWLSWYRYDHTDKKEIDSPVVGGRLLTPIRDVLESLCYIVLWDDASKTVKIIPPAENKITVRFNYNYGIEKSSDKPYFERVSEGEAVTLPIPSRTGFVFDGWHIGRTDGTWVGDGKKSPTYYPAKSVTLYAYWGRKYNITLVTNGGTVATPILRVDIGQSVQLPIPDRTGFTFEDWFLNSDFQGEPVNAKDYHPTDHVTLYAKWKSNGSKIALPYSINQNHNFNHNGENLNLVSKCAGVCAMDISLFYRNISFVGTDNEIESQLSNEMWNLYYCTHYEDPKKTSMFSGNALLIRYNKS